MHIISAITAREILDSRGNPTVEADVMLSSGHLGRAAVPSGASVGTKEALELRDGGNRYLGKGVLKAVANVNMRIAEGVVEKSFASQKELDLLLNELDGTVNKSNLGANAILAVSLAFAKAAAISRGQSLYQYIAELKSEGWDNTNSQIKQCKERGAMPINIGERRVDDAMVKNGNWYNTNSQIKLPRPMMNVINGGVHADNGLDIQEFMIVPMNFSSSREAVRQGAEIFHTLRALLKKDGHKINVGDEGGVAPDISTAKEALDYIMKAISAAGYSPGKEVAIAVDVAASEFYDNGRYTIENKIFESDKLVEYYADLVANYPIISLEDPMSELDEYGWKVITGLLGKKIQIVGDDVFVTNPKILRHGIEKGIANAVLIKLNQIGTLTETLEAIQLAHENRYETIISHRSGETEDVTIAHLAVGSGSWQIKTGSLCRTDRVCKYNELFRIEEELLS